MRIAFDLDSVLNKLEVAWSNWIRQNLDADFTLAQWTSWKIETVQKGGEKAYDFLWIPGMFKALEVRAGAVEVVTALIQEGHEVIVASASHPKTWADKAEWLQEFFPMIPRENCLPIYRKELLSVDVLLDDGPHNVAAVGHKGIVFDQPWNRHVTNRLRAYNFGDFYRLVSGKVA